MATKGKEDEGEEDRVSSAGRQEREYRGKESIDKEVGLCLGFDFWG